ncbi:unnamed protein product [Caretta caretta]
MWTCKLEDKLTLAVKQYQSNYSAMQLNSNMNEKSYSRQPVEGILQGGKKQQNKKQQIRKKMVGDAILFC